MLWRETRQKTEFGKADSDIGISRDEFLEYLDWLYENSEQDYYKAILSMKLMEIGLDDEQVKLWLSQPEELINAIETVLDKDGDPE